MNENKYCDCVGSNKKARRLYTRKNIPIPSKAKTKYSVLEGKYIPMIEGYRRAFVGIGWKCEFCNEIMMDNGKKYVPFEKYHVLEFDYKQLQRNMDKILLEQK